MTSAEADPALNGDEARIEFHFPAGRKGRSYGDLCHPVALMERTARRVLETENVVWSSIGIIVADHELVTDLNTRYLDHDWRTDVLSFLIDESPPVEGEVYVDAETAVERCTEFGTSPADEILRYVVHGLLHLAGHDDATDGQRELMRRLEDRYLAEPGS